ncbi:MAG: SDR family NAD(P)-dependent oxidoreductase [Gammaproteobacteria bacterium]|nr:SDR family NAD(P)-dependent oxidoreductase [Gammaproteobacteria bacterium]
MTVQSISTIDGELRIDIDYSRNFFAAASIQRLGRRYLELLAELIDSARVQPTLRLVSVVQPEPNSGPTMTAANRQEPVSSTPVADRPARVALVTGASRGIGRAIAVKLASQGTAVVLTARNRAELEAVARDITGRGGVAVTIPADITETGQVQAMVDEALRRFGQIDVLVNNAGITGMSSLVNAEPDDWKRIIEINLFGTYNLCRAVAPHMIKRRSGKIVNLGSDSSFIGYPLFSAYAASKHGVMGLTRSLAEELKPHNIQVNAVCPAFVDTNMTPAAFRTRAIPVDAVAEAVSFLASAQAEWITGESVKLYGRQDMYWFGAEKMGGLETFNGLAKAEKAKEGHHG